MNQDQQRREEAQARKVFSERIRLEVERLAGLLRETPGECLGSGVVRDRLKELATLLGAAGLGPGGVGRLPTPQLLRQRMASEPGRWWAAAELRDATGRSAKQVGGALSDMTKSGKVERKAAELPGQSHYRYRLKADPSAGARSTGPDRVPVRWTGQRAIARLPDGSVLQVYNRDRDTALALLKEELRAWRREQQQQEAAA